MNPCRRQMLVSSALLTLGASRLVHAADAAVPAPAGAATPTAVLGSSQAAREKIAPPLPAVGSMLEVPAIELLDGSRFDPAAIAGRPLLVYWWSSTCPFCAVQSPFMDAFWREHHASSDLAMLALSIDKTDKPARDYLGKKGYVFPSAWANPEFQARFPKPKGLPITIVRGRDARVLQAEKGQLFEEDVQELARWLA